MPDDLDAKRNNWLKNSDPSRLTDPVDSKTRAEKSKLPSTKLLSYLRCLRCSAKYSQGDSLTKFPEAKGQVLHHQRGMVTSPGRAPGAEDSPKIPFFSKTGLNCPSLANLSTRSRM